jgi:NhaP-type Na+/H+ or K+/H+ antiporter
MRYILGYTDGPDVKEKLKFSFESSLMFGAIISATDPVAVVALLKELGASKKLATMIEGESLFNDGTAMVLFLIMLDLVEGKDLTFGDMILKFCRLSFGGPILGLLFGFLIEIILHRIHNNYVLEVNLTIVSAYLCWYVAENTALHVSGILAIVALGVWMSYSGKTKISVESEHALHHVWGYVGFAAETLIFMLAGMIIGINVHKMEDEHLIDDELPDTLLTFCNYLIQHVIRFSMICLFWPILNRLGYGMSFK